MKLLSQVLALLIGILFFQSKTFSQKIMLPGDDSLEKKSYGQVSTTYENNSVYFGRKDSVRLSYITPALGYYDKSGFYVDGSLAYLSSTEGNRVDLFTIEAGYEYYGDKWQATAGAAKFFYNSNSTNVKAEVKGNLSGSLGYDFGFITPSLLAGLDFLSGNSDYSVSFNLEHTFSAAMQKLDITPAFLINSGTQNAYGSYYSKRRYVKRKKGAGTGAATIVADVKDASRFKIRDYEFTAPLNYTINKKLVFSFTPTLAIPVNPSAISITVIPAVGPTPPAKVITENLANTFFFSVGISYKF